MRALYALLGVLALSLGLAIAVEWQEDRAASLAAATGHLVYTQGSYAVLLTDKPCDHEELMDAVVIGGGIGDAKAAVVSYGATKRAGCWAPTISGDFVVRDYRSVDAKERDGVLPRDRFKPAPGT